MGQDRGQKEEEEGKEKGRREERRESEGRGEDVKEQGRKPQSNGTLNSISPTPLRCPHICVYNYMTSASVLFHEVISFVKYSNIQYLIFLAVRVRGDVVVFLSIQCTPILKDLEHSEEYS
jgi:hypothetical protein